MSAVIVIAALCLDALWGEPRRGHPLVAFGRLAAWLERHLYRDSRIAGAVAWSVAVLPWVALVLALDLGLQHWPWLAALFKVIVLYLAIGLRSLGEHARPVALALQQQDLPAARDAVSRIVSRDTAALDETGVATAATESVLENGCDAVFAAIFWCLLLGAPGVVLYRLANTLDAMWGYRNARFSRFGMCAARADDVLNFIPARLTALSYALLGSTHAALHAWYRQARQWKSPNAGPVMAAGAGALRVELGGAAPYHGQMMQRPLLGAGRAADAAAILAAWRLVRNGAWLWAGITLLAGLLWRLSHA
ncbi:cobalamin biosynthesis protein [Lysobacteraceae bacterium NML75-0749]|nr:cobalamin biosynthesis protein [Xanthomonadaceae bacterium NML75-0749]PJK05413.1 cobalamin biosynthesis protein [Xanthomonadaceae bacterium NML91-0268]